MKEKFRNLDFSAFNKEDKKSLFYKFLRFLSTCKITDKEIFKQFIIDNSDSLTFREAFQKTGLVLTINVTCTS